jgi:hypothetical protein
MEKFSFAIGVAARNHERPDAQSSSVSDAHWLRLTGPSDARYLRLNARYLRLARDHKSRRTVIETDQIGNPAARI